MQFKKTFLELVASNVDSLGLPARTAHRAQLVRVPEPDYEFYRHWHDSVGRPWGWHLRPRIRDRSLVEGILARPSTQLYMFDLDGISIGYSLVESGQCRAIEIADFGLLPAWVGRGYGTLFLNLLVKHLLARNPRKIWLSTRSTNHPAVVGFYKRQGFRIVGEEWVVDEMA